MTPTHTPEKNVYVERIGSQLIELVEDDLDVLDGVCLWHENPRLISLLESPEIEGATSEEALEAALKQTDGYQDLFSNIKKIGQLEPIYVWRKDSSHKFLVLEGATRVTILRELARTALGTPLEADSRHVKVKILPTNFSTVQRNILLAQIHVRGSGVRAWNRYNQAQFVYNLVAVKKNGQVAAMITTDLADALGKSVSWVSRLKDAYEFAQQFVSHLDYKGREAERLAIKHFSTLEELSKAAGVGPNLKDYLNHEHDGLRNDVFKMVEKGVFKEYRDARFIKEFKDNPESWEILKSGEAGVANRLASDLRSGNSTIKTRIEALPAQIERALDKDKTSAGEEEIKFLRSAIRIIETGVSDVSTFRIDLNSLTKALENASLNDIRSVTADEMRRLSVAYEEFCARHDKHKPYK